MNRPFFLLAPLVALPVAAAVVAVAFLWGDRAPLPVPLPASCNSDAATTIFTPVTGIIVRSESLVTGVGCGTAPDEVFEYVAFVAPSAAADGGSPQFQYATVVQCFADGVLENLSSATAQQFQVSILAFNEETWRAVGPALDPTVDDAGTPQLDALFSMYAPQANWITTCTAAEEQQIQVLAVCAPLAAQNLVADAGADGAPPDAAADAPPDSPADAPRDVAADVATDAPTDAPIDAPTDAPTDATADVVADAPDAD